MICGDRGNIGLALSGGGFRATLFHLGVLRHLRDRDLLRRVTHIASVSGGSILAAHVVNNWQRYALSDDKDFDAAADEVVRMVRHGLRGRIWWRLPWWTLGRLPRGIAARVRGLFRRKPPAYRSGRISLLRREFDHLLAKRTPRWKSLVRPDSPAAEAGGGPQLFLLSTNLVTETVAAAVHDRGVLPRVDMPVTGGPPLISIQTGMFSDSRAVCASAAFPPFFPPVVVTNKELGNPKQGFPIGWQAFADGGVMDNTGTLFYRAMLARQGAGLPAGLRDLPEQILVSDASLAPAQIEEPKIGAIRSALYSNDILYRRIATFERDIARDVRVNGADPRFVFVEISGQHEGPEALTGDVQRQLPFVRTDLDAFSSLEIEALCRHGQQMANDVIAKMHHDVASKAARDSGMPVPAYVPPSVRRWSPGFHDADRGAALLEGPKQQRTVESLQESRERRWLSGAARDPIFWLNILLCLAAIGGLLWFGRSLVASDSRSKRCEVDLQFNPDYATKWKENLDEDNEKHIGVFLADKKLMTEAERKDPAKVADAIYVLDRMAECGAPNNSVETFVDAEHAYMSEWIPVLAGELRRLRDTSGNAATAAEKAIFRRFEAKILLREGLKDRWARVEEREGILEEVIAERWRTEFRRRVREIRSSDMVAVPDTEPRDALWDVVYKHRWVVSEYLRKQLISGGRAQRIAVRLDPVTGVDGKEHFHGFATFEEPRSQNLGAPGAVADAPERGDAIPPPATVFILDTHWLATGEVTLKAVETRCGEVRRYVATLKPTEEGTLRGKLLCTQGPGIRHEAQEVGNITLSVLP